MSQYSSRIHIRVSSPEVWSRFEDEDDASFDLAELAESDKTSFLINGDWSCVENELDGIVEALAKTLGEDGIIVADTTNINVDPYTYCVYYFGEEVHTSFEGDLCFETDIENISEWLNYGQFSISKSEKGILFCCGIAYIGGRFEEFSTDLDMPDKVYLRETGFNGRPDIIEKTFKGEEVYFVHAGDSYDSMRLEVRSELGSLGYMPSDISDQLTPILLNNRLKYTARVVELVRLSKRNKRAKSPIIAISIKAEVTNKDVEIKTSVPKQNRVALEQMEKRETEEAEDCQEEETRRAEEEQRQKEAEARRAEEERRRKEAEAHQAEEERRRKEEEARRAEEDRRRKEEEAHRAEEDRRRKEAEARQAEEECRRKEEEARRAEEERRRKEAEVQQAAEDRRRKKEEARRAKEERRRKEAKARRDAEERRRKEEQVRRAEEKRRQKEEEERKRKEEEARKTEEEAYKTEEEARKKRIENMRLAEEERRRKEEEERLARAEEARIRKEENIRQLCEAVRAGDCQKANALLAAGADVNHIEIIDAVRVPILISAICKGNSRMVKILLSMGANPNCERKSVRGNHNSALRDSIEECPNDEIAEMLISAGANVNSTSENDMITVPVLISAVREGNIKMVKLLLSKGADPNCERVFNDGRRYSALRNSIIDCPNYEITEMLIAAGADVNYTEKNRDVAMPILTSAISRGDTRTAKLLLAGKADPNCERRFNDGRHYSALRDSMFEWPNNEITEMLIAAGADVNYVERIDTGKMPILITAISRGDVRLVRLLLENGADPNCERVSADGNHYSALRDSIEEWPNEGITRLLAEKMKTKPIDVRKKYPKGKFSKETRSSLKKIGVKFSLF